MKIRRLLFTLVLTLTLSQLASAQSSLTDEQIIEFAQREKSKGASNQQIMTSLMRRGVTVARIQLLRRRIEQEENSQAIGGKSTLRDKVNERMRDDRKVDWTNQPGANETDGAQGSDDLETILPEHTYGGGSFGALGGDTTMVFGHDIFNNSKLSFEPNMNIAAPDDYRLGTGDAVFIDIYGASQKTMQATISPEGTVTLEGIGPVNIDGLTVAQANARLRSVLGEHYSSSRIQLTVGKTKTIMAHVMGEVKAPGTYTMSAFATVFHAMYMAGGPNSIGTLRSIKVYRKGRLVSTVDVYDYILNGRMTGNVMLVDDDVIVVDPYHSLVSITGKVKRPMLYELKAGETVAKLVEYAGGFTGDAFTEQVRLVRKTGVEYSIHNVSEFDMGAFEMHDQDEVSVDAVLQRYSNMVEVRGAVFRPGMYQVDGGARTVKELVEMSSGLREEAFARHCVLHRRLPDRTLTAFSVDVEGIMAGTVADVPLVKDDVLFIPTRSDMMIDRTVTIRGEVHTPGTFMYAEGETLEDLILQAGGLTQMASAVKVDIARRLIDPTATSSDSIVSQTFSFAVKDGFVIDGTPGFALQPYDQVIVRRSPGSKPQQLVSISGEVQFEGSYAIDRVDMRLSDLVNVAGGTTRQAYLRGARLERIILPEERVRMEAVLQRAREEVEERENQEKMNGLGKDQDLDYSQALNKFNIGHTYYVGIYLDEALARPGSDADVILREGDRLVIPEYTGTVRINGEVMQTNTVSYKKGEKLKYYINQAGGYSLKAKKSRAYIFYMNGTMAKASKGKIEPGCEIIVPAKIKSRRSLAEILTYASSTASLATMTATIANLLKR